MRIILFLLLAFPVIVNAQINRSATEFAKEQVTEYLTSKIFKDIHYKPVSFGELKPLNEKQHEISWSIDHDFEITESHDDADKKGLVQRPYKFTFYLNNRMKVIKAEASYSIEN